MILGDARRAVHRDDAASASLRWAIQSSPSMGPRSGFHEPPALRERVIDRLANMFVGVVIHGYSLKKDLRRTAPIIQESRRNRTGKIQDVKQTYGFNSSNRTFKIGYSRHS